jgi:peptide-methionine (S)-S-oxide reductase
MDDFGTGYSSLSYLKKFPIDIIKIDRSFINEIPDNQDDMEITSAVIAMAHNLKLKVVAEGIETAEQLAFLRRTAATSARATCSTGRSPARADPKLQRYLPRRLTRPPRNDENAVISETFARLSPSQTEETNAMVLRSEILVNKNELPTPNRPCRPRNPMPVPETHYVNGNPLLGPFLRARQIVFGLGCFWGAERRFWQQGGVSTVVGYAGGFTPNPTYEEVCSGLTGHSEVVLVVYDPQQVSYRRTAEDVLGAAQPDPGHAPGQRHRHPVPLGHLLHQAQKAAIDASRAAFQEGAERQRPGEITTEIARCRRSTTPRPTTSSTWRRTQRLLRPARHRGLPAGIAHACPVGVGRADDPRAYGANAIQEPSAISQSRRQPPWLCASVSASQGNRLRNSSSSGHGGLAMARPEPLRRSALSAGCTSNSARSNLGAPLRSSP